MAQMTFTCPPDLASKLQGLDPNNIPWDTLKELLKWILSLFTSKQATPATLKAAFTHCPDHVCECCHACCEHALAILLACCECCEHP